MLPEQLVVAVDEFGLPYSGKELALVYAVQLLGEAYILNQLNQGNHENHENHENYGSVSEEKNPYSL